MKSLFKLHLKKFKKKESKKERLTVPTKSNNKTMEGKWEGTSDTSHPTDAGESLLLVD